MSKHYSPIRSEQYRASEAKRREVTARRVSGQNSKAHTRAAFTLTVKGK